MKKTFFIKAICMMTVFVMSFAMITVTAKATTGLELADASAAVSTGVNTLSLVDRSSIAASAGKGTAVFSANKGSIAFKKNKNKKKSRVPKPTGVKAWTDSCFEGYLKWNADERVNGYIVYRSVYKQKKFKRIAKVQEPEYYDNKLDAKKRYYYKIKAYKGKYRSAYSAKVTLKTTAKPDGNAARYDIKNVEILPANELTGKTVFFLGSSITYGSAASGQSFADIVAKRNQLNYSKTMKEAVPRTTMAYNRNKKHNSYVERIRRLKANNPGTDPDVFLCQLSVNDANHIPEIGRAAGRSGVVADPEKALTAGQAIDYIINYADTEWPDAHIAFYTCRDNGNKRYAEMVSMLKDAKDTWAADGVDIEILDLWSDPGIRDIFGNTFALYMRDGNHPYKAGYLQLWTPRFETFLKGFFPEIIPDEEISEEVSEEQTEKHTEERTEEHPYEDIDDIQNQPE